MASTRPGVFFGGDAAFGPKNIIWAVAHGHDAAISIDLLLPRRGHRASGRRRTCTLVSQKMGIHEWSYDNAITHRQALPRAAQGHGDRAEGHQASRSSSASTRSSRSPRRSAASTATCRRCSPTSCASSATPASTSARWTASRSPTNGDEADLRTRLRAPALQPRRRTSTSPAPLKTGRIMAKDEDVCLHCGLCAERCPTGAWDMQKFLLEMTHADDTPPDRTCRPHRAPRGGRRSRRGVEPCSRSSASTTSSSSSPTSTARARRPPTGCSRKAILRMGVPVAARNIFPSNIQGLPTWYEVRVVEAGWRGRRGGVDLMVAMNPETWNDGRRRDRARRLPVLRLDQAAAAVASSATTSRCSACRSPRSATQTYTRRAPAAAVQEHHLRRRAVGAARHRARR